jgi:hypothetical protein
MMDAKTAYMLSMKSQEELAKKKELPIEQLLRVTINRVKDACNYGSTHLAAFTMRRNIYQKNELEWFLKTLKSMGYLVARVGSDAYQHDVISISWEA